MPRPVPSNLAAFKRVVGTDPAAGIEARVTVPAGKWWELLSVYLPLVQGATQTPQPILQIDDGTNLIAEIYGATGAQGVSSTAAYSWIAGAAPAGALVGTTPNIKAVAGLPEGFIIPAGYRVGTLTLGIGANTDYGVPSLYVIEYG